MIGPRLVHKRQAPTDPLIRSYWRAPARLIEIQRGPHVGGGRRQ